MHKVLKYPRTAHSEWQTWGVNRCFWFLRSTCVILIPSFTSGELKSGEVTLHKIY